jgi:tRNA 2-selenouridine synthase
MVLIGGMTGSGKTAILGLLEKDRYPVLDLEAIASHRGSALGSLGMPEQPSVEMFENLLWQQTHSLKQVIVESESRKIGTCLMPEGFWINMLRSPVIEVVVSKEQRLQRLVEEYGQFNPELLAQRTEKLRKRLGGLACEEAKDAILSGRKEVWAEKLMRYYDRSYAFFMQENHFKPDTIEWDWTQTQSSLALLKEKLSNYGITK